MSVHAQTTGIREVSASARSLITLQTRLRYTTMIVLPEGEEILDVICGDKDFWVDRQGATAAHENYAQYRCPFARATEQRHRAASTNHLVQILRKAMGALCVAVSGFDFI